MKHIAVAIIVVIGLTALGWFTFDFTGKNPTVEIETETIGEQAEAVIETGKNVLHDTGEALQDIADE